MGYDYKAAELHDAIVDRRRRMKQSLGKLRQLADAPTAALHAGMKHDQTWRRIERRLEAVELKERAKVVDQLIAEAVEAKDVTTLKVLRDELPSYLQAD
jgi:hypothetical protein